MPLFSKDFRWGRRDRDTRKGKRQGKRKSRRSLLQQLEPRVVLDASPANLLARLAGTVGVGGQSTSLPISIAEQDFSTRTGYQVLGFKVDAPEASGLDPAAAILRDETGAPLGLNYSRDDLSSDPASLIVAQVPAGSYTLDIVGEDGTTGGFEVSVLLAGDLDGNREVNLDDRLQMIKLLRSRSYQLEADANQDGYLTAFDTAHMIRNYGLSTTLEPLELTASIEPSPSVFSETGTPIVANSQVTISGESSPEAELQVDIDNDGQADFTVSADTTGQFEFAVDLAENSNRISIETNDQFGQTADVQIDVVLDTNPPALSLDLSPESDSDLVGDSVTTLELVTVAGVTEPGLLVHLYRDGELSDLVASVIADGNGDYQFSGQLLGLGSNLFTATVSDLVGNSSQANLEIIRVVGDDRGPTIALSLDLDTGIAADDRITSHPEMTATFADESAISKVDASLSGAQVGERLDISSYLTSENKILFDLDMLERLRGGSLDDGTYTLTVDAEDEFGNASQGKLSFSLDTAGPSVSILTPENNFVTNTSVSVSGQAADAGSGVVLVEASLDGAAYQTVGIDSEGKFMFSTAVIADGQSDGPHTIQVRATDVAGNQSLSELLSYVIDTDAPEGTINLGADFDTGEIGDGITSLQSVTLIGNTESGITATLLTDNRDVVSDNTGEFVFADVLLAAGLNTIDVQLKDSAGNKSVTSIEVTRQADSIKLREGDDFTVSTEFPITVPDEPSHIVLSYSELMFDETDNSINDAFEIALVGPDGRTLVHTIGDHSDAAFNSTEGESVAAGVNTVVDGQAIKIDLTHIAAGTEATLIARLVNNDADQETNIRLTPPELIEGSLNTPAGWSPHNAADQQDDTPNFELLTDVTGGLELEYGASTFHSHNGTLSVGLSIKNESQIAPQQTLLAVIDRVSDPAVRPAAFDGFTPDGKPYYDFSTRLGATTFATGSESGERTVSFFNPNQEQFDFDVLLFARLNSAPEITSSADTEAILDRVYEYEVAASDLDGDPLEYRLIVGPSGASIDANTGLISWSPAESELGTHAFLVEVSDGHGGTDQQAYTLNVIEPPPNRPPVIKSVPVVDAFVGEDYRYHVEAFDVDGDTLTYSLEATADGIEIEEQSGVIQWLAPPLRSEPVEVVIHVDDSNGGTARQASTIQVRTPPTNAAPIITSTPTDARFSDDRYEYLVSAVDPDGDTLTYDLAEAPAGMEINTTTGLLSWPVPFGGSVRLDSESYVMTDDLAAVLPNDNITIELWVRPDTPGIVMNEAGTPSSFHASVLEVTDTGEVWGRFVGVDPVFLGRLTFGAWNHLVLRYNESSESLDGFVNGEKSTTTSQGSRRSALRGTGAQYFGLGSDETASIFEQKSFTGELDDVRIWNVNRTDDEILSTKDEDLNGNETGLVQYFTFQSAQHALEFDSSSANIDASLEKTESWSRGPFPWRSTRQVENSTVKLLVLDQLGASDQQSFELDFTELHGAIRGSKISTEHWSASANVRGVSSPYQIGTSLDTSIPIDLPSNVSALHFETSGSVWFSSLPVDSNDGDGVNWLSRCGLPSGFVCHYDGSQNGISDVAAPVTSLVGVFVADVVDRTIAPDPLSFHAEGSVESGLNFETLSPQLQQLFFIGNGVNSDGTPQRIEVPENASRLHLAVMDHTAWYDNLGGYTVGIRDANSGVEDWPIYIDQNSNGRHDANEPITSTDSSGLYEFPVVPNGNHLVREILKPGWDYSEPSDGSRRVDVESFEITPNINFRNSRLLNSNENRPPEFISVPPDSATVGETLHYEVLASDPDLDDVEVALVHAPAGMAFDPATSVVAWEPQRNQVGLQYGILRVRDGRGGVDLQPFAIEVSKPNNLPVFVTSPAPSLASTGAYRYAAKAIDPDGDVVTYTLASGPDGMSVDSSTGLVSYEMPDDFLSGFRRTLSDSEFIESGWSSTTFSSGPLAPEGNSKTEFDEADSNSFRKNRIDIPATEGDENSVVILANTGEHLAHDPSNERGILTVDFTIETRGIPLDSRPLIGFTVLQDGRLFRSETNVISNRTGDWEMLSVLDLKSTDFFLVESASALLADLNTHPDFSAAGAPLQFGYFLRSGSGPDRPSKTVLLDVDNFSATISTAPTFEVVLRASDELNSSTQKFSIQVSNPSTIRGVVFQDENLNGTWDKPTTIVSGSAGSGNGLHQYILDGGTYLGKIVDEGLYTNSQRAISIGSTGNIFATEWDLESVVEIDSETGRIVGRHGTGHLSLPQNSATGNDGRLYVSAEGTDSIEILDESTGGHLGTFIDERLSNPRNLQFGADGDLYVMSTGNGRRLDHFNGVTGQWIRTVASGLRSPHFVIDDTGHFFVSNPSSGTVDQFSLSDGSLLGVFVSADESVNGGLGIPRSLAIASTGDLFVSDYDNQLTLQYDGQTGDFIGALDRSAGVNVFLPSADNPENGLEGRVVFLDEDGDGILDPHEVRTETDAAGVYEFEGLSAGKYVVVHQQQPDWFRTSPATREHVLQLTENDSSYFVNFGAQQISQLDENQPPVFETDAPYSAIAERLYSYDPVVSDREDDPLTWALAVGPDGMVVDPFSGRVRWIPTTDQLGEHDVLLEVTDGNSAPVTQAFTLTVRSNNRPPVLDSSPITTAVVQQPYLYSVSAFDGDGDELSFSLQQAPFGMQIDSVTGVITWTPVEGQLGTFPVEVSVEDPVGGSATQVYDLVVQDESPNQAPEIISSPSYTAKIGDPYTYTVVGSDPDSDRVLYSLLEGPKGMLLDPVSGQLTWSPVAAQAGLNRVTVAAVDPSGAAGTQSFLLRTIEDLPPQFISNPRQSVLGSDTYSYTARAFDPNGDTLVYSLVQGPEGMAIDVDSGRIVWQTTIDDVGDHPVEVAVSDGLHAPVSQTFVLEVLPDTILPSIQIQFAETEINIGESHEVVVRAIDNVEVASLTLLVNGEVVDLDFAGRGEFAVESVGEFDIVATAVDSSDNGATESLTVNALDPSDVDAPVLSLDNPVDGMMITGPTDIIGSVEDGNLAFYRLGYAAVDSAVFTTFAEGNSNVDSAALGKLDPTVLPNGSYWLRLSAEDVNGKQSQVDRFIEVAGDLKIGNFALSFTDLTVPVSGVPIIVSRTYDSLKSGKRDDLGYGWRMEIRDTDLRTSIPETGNEDYGIYTPYHSGARVYVNIPGEGRQGFTFAPKPKLGIVNQLLGLWQPEFESDAGVDSTLSVDPADLQVFGGQFYSYGGSFAYNPASPTFGGKFTLTSKEGLVYEIDASSGDTRSIGDRNGNQLTFSDAGIRSSAGPEITFERDPQGRVTAVIDPEGNRVSYNYDAAGDLVAVTDREGNVTRYVYDEPSRPHFLTEVIDPLGRSGVRSEYDDSGRLVKMVDADGEVIELVHDTDNFVERVKNQLGHETTFVYDTLGNVLVERDAEGGVTRYEYSDPTDPTLETAVIQVQADGTELRTEMQYDARGNVTVETDPLGHKTYYSYDGFGNVLSSTDALGNTTTNRYDRYGNLVSTTDADGLTSSFSYDVSGNPTRLAVGSNVTTFEYDGAGRVTQQVDAVGTVRTFTYDANGNQLSESVTFTSADGPSDVVTENVYDDEGRVIKTTVKQDGVLMNQSETRFDAVGNRVESIDVIGRVTKYIYDDRGQLVETIYPDATPDDDADNPRMKTVYDAAGQVLSQTDELGRVTRFEYDDASRQTKTILPAFTEVDPDDLDPTDNPFTQTTYDAVGRVTSQIDERGNATRFVYDAAGRTIETILPDDTPDEADNPRVRQVYDAAVRSVASIDPLGNTTKFVYSDSGLLTETILPDGTPNDDSDNSRTKSVYDAERRLSERVDANGNSTKYEYDPLGRLSAVLQFVTDPDTDQLKTLRTEYTYDELGNLITQTDALGRTTRYEYDGLGRRTATELPLGQRSESEYNLTGTVASMTDFNGDTIEYDYDVENQLIAKHFPDGSSVQFTYTENGQRESYTDDRGVTTWSYDAQNRLTSRTDPDGASISYTYDVASNRTSVTTTVPNSDPRTTFYTFDAQNRMKTVVDHDGDTTQYFYDLGSRLIRTDFPNNTQETREYDAQNRLTLIEHQNTVSDEVFASFAYEMDKVGNRTAVNELDRRVEYGYDELYRLLREDIHDDFANDPTRSIGYVYDDVGNRLSRNDSAEGVTTYQYDNNDRLLEEAINGVVTDYRYDDNGNTIAKSIDGTDQVIYQWDHENRLIAADTDGDGTNEVAYEYDADGIRVTKTIDPETFPETTQFLLDANRPYQQVLEEYSSGGILQVSYVHGQDLISQTQPSGSGKSFFHAEGLGSSRVLSDAESTDQTTFQFDAFGRELKSFGHHTSTYMFAGEQSDNATRLDYLRARWMNPENGRFISQDSVEGVRNVPLSLNKYAYAHANPVMHTDPTGESILSIAATAGVVAFAGLLFRDEIVDFFSSISPTNYISNSPYLTTSTRILAIAKSRAGDPNMEAVAAWNFGEIRFSGLVNLYGQAARSIKHPIGKIDELIINAHGSPDLINFEGNDVVDVHNFHEYEYWFHRLGGLMAPGGRVKILACNAGGTYNGTGGDRLIDKIARAMNVEVRAYLGDIEGVTLNPTGPEVIALPNSCG